MPHLKSEKTCSACMYGETNKWCSFSRNCLDCSNYKPMTTLKTRSYADNHLCSGCACLTISYGKPCPYYKRNTFIARIKERLNIFKLHWDQLAKENKDNAAH